MNLIRLLRTKRERCKSNNKITLKDGSQLQDGTNNSQYQAKDNAVQIINATNPNDTKAKLILQLDTLNAEKQKWIDNELVKQGLFGSTLMAMKDIYRKAAARYDERIKSFKEAIAAL